MFTPTAAHQNVRNETNTWQIFCRTRLTTDSVGHGRKWRHSLCWVAHKNHINKDFEPLECPDDGRHLGPKLKKLARLEQKRIINRRWINLEKMRNH